MAKETNIRHFKQLYTFQQDVYVARGYDLKQASFGKIHSSGNYIIFCLCHKGSAKMKLNDGTRSLQAGGHLAIIPRTYTSLIEASKDFDCSFVAFSPTFRQENRYHASLPFIDALLFIKEQAVMQLSELQQDYFIKMRDLVAQTITAAPPVYIKQMLRELSSLFFIWEDSTIAANIKVSPTNKKSRDVLVTKFMSLVSEHFKEEHRLEFYANSMHITPKYLSAIVKSVTGRTASQWIDSFLITEAQNLLTTSTMNISEISDGLGFPNQSFFGKYFKHHTGRSPLAYRYKPTQELDQEPTDDES